MRVIIYLIPSWAFGEIFVGKKYGGLLIETKPMLDHRFIVGVSLVFFSYSVSNAGYSTGHSL